MNIGAARTLIALALQLAALVALSLSLLGVSWLDSRSKPRVLVLVDRSESVPRAAGDAALADVVRAEEAAGSGEVQMLEFAGRAGAPSAPPATTPNTSSAAKDPAPPPSTDPTPFAAPS